MTDYFAVMDEPRRPWLDPDALKAKYFRFSSRLHPDRNHGAATPEKQEAQRRFTQLNTAYHCLLDPRQRLRHLVELETGTPVPRVEEVPPALMDSFLEIGDLCRQTDTFLQRKAAASSRLLEVEMFQEGQQWLDRLGALHQRISEHRESSLRRLTALDQRWTGNQRNGSAQPGELVSQLAELYRLLGYVHRWSAQVQGRIVQLTL